MSIKVTGVEFKAFMEDESVWSVDGKPSWYVEDLVVDVMGQETNNADIYERYGENLEALPDDARLNVTSGYLIWQGRGTPPQQMQDLLAVLNHWKNQQTNVIITGTFNVAIDDVALQQKIEKLLLEHGATVKRSDGKPQEDADSAPVQKKKSAP